MKRALVILALVCAGCEAQPPTDGHPMPVGRERILVRDAQTGECLAIGLRVSYCQYACPIPVWIVDGALCDMK